MNSNDPQWLGQPGYIPGDDPEPQFDWKCMECGRGCYAHLAPGILATGRLSYCCNAPAIKFGDTYPKQFRAEVLVSDGLINALESISRDGDTDADGWAEVAAHVDALKRARERA